MTPDRSIKHIQSRVRNVHESASDSYRVDKARLSGHQEFKHCGSSQSEASLCGIVVYLQREEQGKGGATGKID